MGTVKKYTPFFVSAMLLYVALFIIYPHYQYYIDPDGTAYLTISKRYAAGDFAKAVNGYWSPWSCWLTALLIRCGMRAIPASVVINTLGATGFLVVSQSFYLRFNIVRKLQWLFGGTLAFFLCYAIFGQSFDDLWECFFLLLALRLLLCERFVVRPVLWVAYGVIGTFAYFAKAYSFPFFILNTVCCVYFLCKNNKAQWMKISLTAIAVMMACSLPWIMALHDKYGIWTTSTAGPLNMSWYLVGHPQWKEGIDLLVPPVYADSPYYWEDPWFANGATPHFWDAWHLFGLQILRVGLNGWKFVVSSLELSVFFPLIVIMAVLSLVHKKVGRIFKGDLRIVIVSFLLFPAAYFLVNFESRYIWYMVPLSMVLGGLFIEGVRVNGRQRILSVLFPITFLVYPAFGLCKMYDEGANEYKAAEQLNQLNIHGTFTCMAAAGVERQRMERLAYFSGNELYSLSKPEYTKEEVLMEMHRYHIKYYFGISGSHVTDSQAVFPRLRPVTVSGFDVWLINLPAL